MQLRAAVRVRRFAGRAILGEGKRLGRAVDRRRGAEDDAVDALPAHGREQHERAVDVVVVVPDGLADGFAHGLEACEVNDGVDAVERLLHGGGVADVAFDEDGATARDRLDSVENGAVGVGEIVEEHDVMAGLDEHDGRMGADEAHAAGEQNVHVWVLRGEDGRRGSAVPWGGGIVMLRRDCNNSLPESARGPAV